MTTKAKYRNGIFTMFDSSTHEHFPVAAPIQLYDDFLGTVVNTDHWTEVEVGDSTKAIAASILTYHIHVTGETEEAGIYGKDDKPYDIGKGLVFECRMAVHVAPTIGAEVIIGVQNDNYSTGSNRMLNADEIAKYAAFGFYATLDAGLGVAIRTDDGTAVSGIIDSGKDVLVDAYHIYRIDFTTLADVLFFIDGAQVAASTTFNMSTAATLLVQPIVMAQKNGVDAGLCDIYVDYIRIWQAER